MSDSLTQIRTQIIESAQIDDEEIALRLANGWAISIYNATSLHVRNEAKTVEHSLVVNARIVAIESADDSLTFALDNSSTLIVDLRDAAYHGPEAVVLRGPLGEFIVLN